MAEKQLNDKQLLEAATDGLSVEQIQRRSVLINLQSAERGLEAAAQENEKAIAAREQKLREHKARMQDIQAQQAEQERIQTICYHQTGGKDRAGFYAGDGDIYGASISKQTLPTSETYALCVRCSKEWHRPEWVERYFPGHSEKMSLRKAVTLGLFPLAEYNEMIREFQRVIRLKARTFEGLGGEYPASVQFNIPALRDRHAKEAAEFAAYLAQLPAKELRAAGAA